jgi:uncharacterized coiled-coil protein SlyX
MNWNPYKRIAELESVISSQVNYNNSLVNNLAELKRQLATHTQWLVVLETRLKELQTQNPNTVATMTMGEFKKAKTREYARARYAKIKAEKLGGVK